MHLEIFTQRLWVIGEKTGLVPVPEEVPRHRHPEDLPVPVAQRVAALAGDDHPDLGEDQVREVGRGEKADADRRREEQHQQLQPRAAPHAPLGLGWTRLKP